MLDHPSYPKAFFKAKGLKIELSEAKLKKSVLIAKCTKKIIIRKANQSDCRDVLKWRNDEISRKMFFNQKNITPKMHKVWFFEVLNNNNKVMYIGELDNYKVGVCRFDFDKSRLVSEVSININPHLRGKG